MNKLTQQLGYAPLTIAVFRAIRLGDLLCAVPAFRALRTAYPQAHISLISLPWAEEFVQCYPQYFDEFISFPGWPGLPEQPPEPDRILTFLGEMQRRQWDVVLQMQGNGTLVNVMLSLFGARSADLGPYVCIHAGGISGRRWPEHQFAGVADALAGQGYSVVMTGSAGEVPIIDAVRQRMKQPAVSLAGQTTLRSLGALLQEPDPKRDCFYLGRSGRMGPLGVWFLQQGP